MVVAVLAGVAALEALLIIAMVVTILDLGRTIEYQAELRDQMFDVDFRKNFADLS